MHNQFSTFINYWGYIGGDETTDIYAYENISENNTAKNSAEIPALGGCFGYVHSGTIFLSIGKEIIQVNEGWWFSTAFGAKILASSQVRFVIWQRKGYLGTNSLGKVEPKGRLGYIDGCMNSVLSGPHKKGLPVLNALYMPTAIHQTMHTHPSLRSGIIIQGDATCNTPKEVDSIDYSSTKDTDCNVYPLVEGAVFILPADGWHKFRTDLTKGTLSLIAYHPDSDFGPDDEDAPMLNRTMVGKEGEQHSAKHEKNLLTNKDAI